jgi:hypothetical protein
VMRSMMIALIRNTEHFVLLLAHLQHIYWRPTWSEESLFLSCRKCKLVILLKKEQVSSENLTLLVAIISGGHSNKRIRNQNIVWVVYNTYEHHVDRRERGKS